MKPDIHPKYYEAKVHCGSCGTEWTVGSTRPELRVDVCSNCHPFFTGKQKLMDTAGRIEKFKTRYAATPGATATAETKPAAPVAAPKKAEAPKENRAAKRAKAGKSKAKTEAAPAPAAAEPKAE